MMDRLLVLMLAGILLPHGLSHAGSLTAERQESLRVEIRQNFFVPDPLPSLNGVTQRRFEPAPGVAAEAVTYATQLGTRVPAILYLPKPKQKTAADRIPALIIVNGHGGDKYSWYSYYSGILYARAGAAVLTYDQAGEGERNAQRKSGTRTHDRLKGDDVLARRLAGLMITDVMQAVSYLASRPEVDPRRIGATGYSLGSFVLALSGAVEPRLKACVLVGGGNLDGVDGYWDNAKPMCQGLPYRSLRFLGDRGAVIYALHASRGPTLIYNGLADSVVAIDRHGEPFFADLRQRTIKLRGGGDGVFDTGFVAKASHRPYFITRPVALWLEKHLDMPNWTAESLAAMPTTHIAQWAQKYDVQMDKLYAAEDREGGTPALGNDIPGFQRDQLSVFTPEQWRFHKQELTFETWVDAARLAVQQQRTGQKTKPLENRANRRK
ncbi:MAG: acetylxylan esterase [Phycisphaerales bacterium]|nr:MAG: acetylxylan esterase [Phycisphaerales bacterium]